MTAALFLPPASPMPEVPMFRRRRFIIGLLILGLFSGGAGLALYNGLAGDNAPIPRPGPRKYPPAYYPRKAVKTG